MVLKRTTPARCPDSKHQEPFRSIGYGQRPRSARVRISSASAWKGVDPEESCRHREPVQTGCSGA